MARLRAEHKWETLSVKIGGTRLGSGVCLMGLNQFVHSLVLFYIRDEQMLFYFCSVRCFLEGKRPLHDPGDLVSCVSATALTQSDDAESSRFTKPQ